MPYETFLISLYFLTRLLIDSSKAFLPLSNTLQLVICTLGRIFFSVIGSFNSIVAITSIIKSKKRRIGFIVYFHCFYYCKWVRFSYIYIYNLNATLNKLNDTFHENNLIIDQKLDNICTLIKNNNITTQQHLTNENQTSNVSHTKENINQQLLNRWRLHYQILRSQDLQECYNNLISQESP